MGDLPTMEVSISDTSFSEVLIVLPANPNHLLLEARELILQVFKVVLQNIQLSRLPAHQFSQFVGLENPLQSNVSQIETLPKRHLSFLLTKHPP